MITNTISAQQYFKVYNCSISQVASLLYSFIFIFHFQVLFFLLIPRLSPMSIKQITPCTTFSLHTCSGSSLNRAHSGFIYLRLLNQRTFSHTCASPVPLESSLPKPSLPHHSPSQFFLLHCFSPLPPPSQHVPFIGSSSLRSVYSTFLLTFVTHKSSNNEVL